VFRSLLCICSFLSCLYISVRVPRYLLPTNYKTSLLLSIFHLRVVLYGCETWSLTLREERWLRVFQNRVLRRIFGPKGDEVTGKWRKLHNEKLHDLYSSPNVVRVIKLRRMIWAGHVALLRG
jgi:hypothetical protein